MTVISPEWEDPESQPIHDWLTSHIDAANEYLTRATLLGTLSIAHYQIGKADFEPITAAMVLAGVDPTDDMPVKRGVYLYDRTTQAVNYLEQQVGTNNPVIWLEELAAGTANRLWSSNIFGDIKTLAIDAITGHTMHGQQINAAELETWNTSLLRSVPIDNETASLAVKASNIHAVNAGREYANLTDSDRAVQQQLAKAVAAAVRHEKRERKRHGIT